MFECAAFCGRMCVGHTEPPGGVCAKIFYQIDSVCSTFLCVRFHFTMNQLTDFAIYSVFSFDFSNIQ